MNSRVVFALGRNIRTVIRIRTYTRINMGIEMEINMRIGLGSNLE